MLVGGRAGGPVVRKRIVSKSKDVKIGRSLSQERKVKAV
jgi:hypothetical protein